MNHLSNGEIAVGAPGSFMTLIAELPEPSEPRINYHPSTQTPWGQAQSAEAFTDGIILYSTASHGGFHVSKKLLSTMPDYLRTADGYADGERGWFEEDCASAIVVVCFPQFFPRQWRENAVGTMQHFYGAQWQRFLEERRG